MRVWILCGLLFVACSASTVTPTRQANERTPMPSATMLSGDAISPSASATAVPVVPVVRYLYAPTTNELVQQRDETNQLLTTIPTQHVVANGTHTMLAIRTRTDETFIYDVSTSQRIGPFDACDSMTWAPDNTTLWCMRFGHLYTIDQQQSDKLSVVAPADTYWAELIQHPTTREYWMLSASPSTNQLCTFNPDTYITSSTCMTAGSQPRWSPDGAFLAYTTDQQVVVRDTRNTVHARAGLGSLTILQMTWIDQRRLILTTPSQVYAFEINDARISLQASEAYVVGR